MNIQPTKPDKCPVCGENAVEALENNIDIFGKSTDFILELQGMEAEMILIRGWTCQHGKNSTQGVFGTVLRYKVAGEIVDFVSPNHCYMIFNGDKIST